jgi:hypothetical protein
VKESFYEDLECASNTLPEFHMKILFGDFTAIVGREVIFKLTFWNECLHKISHENGFKAVNVAMSKKVTIKSAMFLQCDIHKYIRRLQMRKPTLKLSMFS